ncbi:MAG: alpha-ketoacid dehydrogenase subunit beta [Oligoflexales bacterium]|nr:alpha-ketoacid dehydrogenase subunit beta [Oligoflexales bacterium]
MQNRILTYAAAINEATSQMLECDPSVFLIGIGVPDPTGGFTTTLGLQEKHGKNRVFDMPVSENCGTGVVIGAALMGYRPILVHLRNDFTLYAMDQMVNNAAKWYSMYGGQKSVPIVIRMIIGMGWGQGNQHSQNLQNVFAHIPGLKVVVPANAYDAKGMLIAAVRDNNPVIFLEHRWVHYTTSYVPQEIYEVPLGKANVLREGENLTIVTWGQMVLETLKANEFLAAQDVHAEIIDLRSLDPFDEVTVKKSVSKTGRLLVVDGSWRTCGFAGEIIARICEDEEIRLLSAPKRITYPDFAVPSSPGLANLYYPRSIDIFKMVGRILDLDLSCKEVEEYHKSRILDAPDANFRGPF